MYSLDDNKVRIETSSLETLFDEAAIALAEFITGQTASPVWQEGFQEFNVENRSKTTANLLETWLNDLLTIYNSGRGFVHLKYQTLTESEIRAMAFGEPGKNRGRAVIPTVTSLTKDQGGTWKADVVFNEVASPGAGISFVTFPAEGYVVHVYFLKSEKISDQLLEFARQRGIQSLIGNYKYRFDPQRTDFEKKHVHVFFKNTELFAINFDGTPHHRSSAGVEIPKPVFKALNAIYPDWKFPQNRIIEYATLKDLTVGSLDPDSERLIKMLVDYLN